MSTTKIQDAAVDSFDERNFNYSEVAGQTYRIQKRFHILDDGIIQDQYSEGYPMWCVHYWSSMHDNYINARDSGDKRSSWAENCDWAEKIGMFDPVKWTYIINWPKYLKHIWLIAWYSQVTTSNEAADSLDNMKPIDVWTNKINFTKTNSSPFIALWDSGPWHKFHIIWYNNSWESVTYKERIIPDGVFIAKDSSFSFDNGFFYIKIVDYEKLLYPTRLNFVNVDELAQYMANIIKKINLDSAVKAYELKIWNGERPKDTVTREECAAMIMRSIELQNKN